MHTILEALGWWTIASWLTVAVMFGSEVYRDRHTKNLTRARMQAFLDGLPKR